MVDFLVVAIKKVGSNLCVYPKFRLYPKSKDLMTRGSDFYAVWLEDKGVWSTNEDDVMNIIDDALREYTDKDVPDTFMIMVAGLSLNASSAISSSLPLLTRTTRPLFSVISKRTWKPSLWNKQRPALVPIIRLSV